MTTSGMFGQFGSAGKHETSAHDGEAGALRQECRRVQTAKRILAARRLRSEHFSTRILGDPAWDLLLGVYIREVSGMSSPVAELNSEQEWPLTTVARWLNALQEQGLVRRRSLGATGDDFVELTDDGQASLDRYLSAVSGM